MCKARDEFFGQIKEDNQTAVDYWQDGRRTACRIDTCFGISIGWSECGPRDRFDAEMGKEIALGRAIQHLWERHQWGWRKTHPQLQAEARAAYIVNMQEAYTQKYA